jgi:hypothetical protein
MSDELSRRLREIQTRRARQFDQELQEFKLSFESLTSEGQTWLKQWLARAEEMAREVPNELGMSIRVHVDHLATDSEGDVHYEGHGTFGPATLLKAIQAWETGEEFSPDALVW